ncbi:MAG: SMP-30/gluconolactonase/LRE family protein [Vicinamibacterales bacterium]
MICSGLKYPEGPIFLPDGSIVLCELAGGTLTRVSPEGRATIIAALGGSPNGAAIGPDGKVYVCNSGGFTFLYIGDKGIAAAPYQGAICLAGNQPPTYIGGSIQRVDIDSGTFETLYTQFTTAGGAQLPLKGPDDIVFDDEGGLWFTDWGKARERDRDATGIYYARADGSSIREVLFPLDAPNGIGLSPDRKRLYVAETYTRRVLFWELAGPGQIAPTGTTIDHSRLLTAQIPGQGLLDSMTLDDEGNVYVATLLPHGNDFTSNGGITVISPAGEVLDFIELAVGSIFDPLPSNICFGGPDRRTAFITLGGSGRLVACEMRVPGLPPAFHLEAR